jgi:molecular chaperone GrpE
LSSEENKRDPEPEEEAAEDIQAPEGDPAAPETEAEDDEAPEVVDGESSGDEETVLDDEAALDVEGFALLAEELEATRLERDQYLDALRRLKAEFENSRKRQERERARILSMASERLVQELLPVLDNLDRALEAGGDIREGVQATREQLAEVLAEEGLLPVASDGQPFDPNVHDAVMGQPSEEHEDGTIIQTFQRGYLLNGKPIRPAKVVVAKQV